MNSREQAETLLRNHIAKTGRKILQSYAGKVDPELIKGTEPLIDAVADTIDLDGNSPKLILNDDTPIRIEAK